MKIDIYIYILYIYIYHIYIFIYLQFVDSWQFFWVFGYSLVVSAFPGSGVLNNEESHFAKYCEHV